MRDFVEYVVKQIVDNPDDVMVEEGEDDKGKVLTVKLAESDKAFVIGKGGRNIKAVRDLASIVGKKNNERFYIKIAD
jgi:uncharacterized protein